MNNPCAIYSDYTLECIIRELSMTGQWPSRLKQALAEQSRRNKA